MEHSVNLRQSLGGVFYMKFLLAKKVNMTQVFGEDGSAKAVTVLATSPMTVTQIKNKVRDGYEAVQVATGTRREKNIPKPVRGQMKDLGNFATIKEFRLGEGTSLDTYKRGDKIGLETFAIGDRVEVSSISKGKGFQGVVKRHGFGGGPRSHGQKHSEREPGSIGGAGRDGGRVAKGKRMAGRMGSDRVTVKNLKVLNLDLEKNILMISGAIPGRRGTLVEIRTN